MSRRYLMLVSGVVDRALREQVNAGRRPRPEYLVLEEEHGVELLDWSRLSGGARRRSLARSVLHAGTALRALGDFDAVLSDGEHLGIPLALGMRSLRRRTPHVVIGHHVTTPAKRMAFRRLRPQQRISRLLLHSQRQLELALRELALPPSLLRFLPYGVDQGFWAPQAFADEPLVVTAGREHRDFASLGQACADLRARVLVAHASSHSPRARRREPATWPANFEVRALDHLSLRDAYARASVVVVPVLPADFQAGVTTLLEAMSMGKAVLVSATAGLHGLVEDGVTAATVPPADPRALREALTALLANPPERARLGANARSAVERSFGIDRYAAGLAGQLDEVSGGTGWARAASPFGLSHVRLGRAIPGWQDE